MKRPLAYITAPWGTDEIDNREHLEDYLDKITKAGAFRRRF